MLNLGGLLLVREPFNMTNSNAGQETMTATKFIDLVQSKVIDNSYGYDLVFAKPNKALTLLNNDQSVI
jgi:hypothetical protein